MSSPSRLPALVLALALAIAGLAIAGPAAREARAAPGIATRTEIELAVIAAAPTGGSLTTFWVALIHLDVRLSYATSALVLRLDPGILAGPVGLGTWGLTEAYLEWRRPTFDLRAGVERIPLETARLTVPFSIEAADTLGTRQGRLGARLNWYADQATRLRLAMLEDEGRVQPLVSLRRAFTSFEVEAHALAFGEGRTALGAGASGLVGNLVAYGEVWTLSAPSETRYAAGLSGSIAGGLWTIEAGRAASLAGALARLQPGVAPVRLQVAGQVMRRLSDEITISGTGRVFFDADARRGQAVLEITRAVGNAAYSVALVTMLGPEPAQIVATASVRLSF